MALGVSMLLEVPAYAEPIVVGVASGRVFVGEIDRKSNRSQLWLRTEQSGISLRRPIDWDTIAVVRSGGRELSPEKLRTEIELRLVSYVPDDDPFDDRPPKTVPPGADKNAKPQPKEWLPAPAPESASTGLRPFIDAVRANNLQVCSISIDANVGHWYKTVEANGIILHLYPLSGGGTVVPIDGTLDVELIASVPAGSLLGVPLPRIGAGPSV